MCPLQSFLTTNRHKWDFETVAVRWWKLQERNLSRAMGPKSLQGQRQKSSPFWEPGVGSQRLWLRCPFCQREAGKALLLFTLNAQPPPRAQKPQFIVLPMRNPVHGWFPSRISHLSAEISTKSKHSVQFVWFLPEVHFFFFEGKYSLPNALFSFQVRKAFPVPRLVICL